MSNIDKRALREAAEKAGSDKWQAKKINGDFYVIRNGSYEKQHGFTSYQPIAEIEHKPVRDFVAAANPATVLALLDELEAKDNRINRLEAIVAVAEQRNALMREWKRALKAPCDLVDDQVPVVIHGMVIRLERLKETEAKLEVAEKRNERALALLKDANTENVWEIIGRLKVVISGDYRSEAEIAAAATAGKGE
ncbi:ead/Ea22-like family protein [Enterobacter hormaechei]|uniref:ead/Ea22-like family protein n=1 Tax=Enterobacter hormaechei TaxID=158836 RepID=UPI0021CD2262|nr:ead/Ea22-like family protein [Enterobacter hormaechei]